MPAVTAAKQEKEPADENDHSDGRRPGRGDAGRILVVGGGRCPIGVWRARRNGRSRPDLPCAYRERHLHGRLPVPGRLPRPGGDDFIDWITRMPNTYRPE